MERIAQMHKEHIHTQAIKSERPGYIYVLHDSVTGDYKVGSTVKSVSSRFDAQRDKYDKFIHAVYTKSPRSLEKYLHRMFAHKSVDGKGERGRFKLSPFDIDFIMRIKSVNGEDVSHPIGNLLLV